MTILATDSFTDTDGVTLVTHNSDWTQDAGDYRIISNKIRNYQDDFTRAWARYTAVTPNNDQYASAVMQMSASDGSVWGGVAVRMDSSVNGYALLTNNNNTRLYRIDAGTSTILVDIGSAPVDGDVLKLEVEGSNLRGYINDILITGFDTTDATYASGDIGISGQQNGSQADLESWEGGNLDVGVSAVGTKINIIYNREVTG